VRIRFNPPANGTEEVLKENFYTKHREFESVASAREFSGDITTEEVKGKTLGSTKTVESTSDDHSNAYDK